MHKSHRSCFCGEAGETAGLSYLASVFSLRVPVHSPIAAAPVHSLQKDIWAKLREPGILGGRK